MTPRSRLALAVGLALLLTILWWRPDLVGRAVGPCLFHEWTGRPCFTCGTTRALTALTHGQAATALRANPLAVLAVVGAVIWVVRPITPRRWRWWLAAAVTATAANWTYLLLTQ